MSQSNANPLGGKPEFPPASNFVHLHVHSEYSVLDGACRIGLLLDRCAELGMTAVAITDHGVLSSAAKFFREAEKKQIKPIIGMEAYLVNDRKDKTQPRENRFHLTLLAVDNTGYQNLIQISSRGFMEGYYFKPRVDKEVLREYSEGLIILSGCLNGKITRLLQDGDKGEALKELHDLQDIYGKENVYLEIQDQGLAEQKEVNPRIIELAEEQGVPLVATNDVHYLKKEDAVSHDALLCIQTGNMLDDPNRLKFTGEDFYLKSEEEMAVVFSGTPEALTNTGEIAKRCNVELDFGRIHLPSYAVPDGSDRDAYLRQQCEAGLKVRYKDGEPPGARERLEFELKTIQDMGFAAYFLIVWDFVKFAKDNDVAVGPGRGSAAGSLVSYALGITDVDPLKYDLLFERFLNPGRKSMPDIDIDFSPAGRERVLSYVAERYGRKNVAQIITFGTMAARMAIRDAGRVMGISYSEVDKVVKLIPDVPGTSLASCLRPGQDLRNTYDEDEQAREMIDLGLFLEGLVRQDSIHAAGVVISDKPLTNYVPLQQKGDAEVVTQFTMGDLEDLGLLKMDFLGLRNLDIIKEAVKLIRESKAKEIDVSSLPLDDEKTFGMMSRGQSDGVFQFESSGMKESLREVKPSRFEDLIALVALYRPGPMQFISEYARNKKDPEEVTYDDPRLKEILEPTHGVAIYQEQLMEIAKALAGFSPAEADDLRKAIAKKKRDLLSSLKDKFLEGCKQNGVERKVAGRQWGLMEAAGDYSFNKSHAVGYALISYQTAYLKANYPVEYMAATISSVMSTKDKVPFYVNACSGMGIEVQPPDVNKSRHDFTVIEERILFGLSAVKNVGKGVIDAIIAAREEEGDFTSIYDFCRRVDSTLLNKKALESLIKSGALDSTGATRKGMLEVMAQALVSGAQNQHDSRLGQSSIFDLVEEGSPHEVMDPPLPKEEFSSEELLRLEKEALGLFLSSHPLSGLESELSRMGAVSMEALRDVPDRSNATVAGMIAKVKSLMTKRGDPMAFVTLEDMGGSAEVIVFTELYGRRKELLVEDEVVIVKGRVDHKEGDNVKIIASEINELTRSEQSTEEPAGDKVLQLDFDIGKVEEKGNVLETLKGLCLDYPGAVPIVLNIYCDDGVRKLKFGNEFHVQPRNEFISLMQNLLGSQGVRLMRA